MKHSESLVVSCAVVTDDQGHATRAVEAFARAAAGLAFEGMLVTVTVSGGDHEEVTDG